MPQPGAKLPTSPIDYNPALLQSEGVTPYNMCILAGFPTELAKTATSGFPFGLWFANPTTLYVADEGDGTTTYSAATNTYTDAAAQTTAGLQKWVFNKSAGEWQLAYTLQSGLNLGQPYTVPGYPTGNNSVTGTAVGSGHRRPAQPHRSRQPRRHRHDLGDHLDRERERRPGRRSEQARCRSPTGCRPRARAARRSRRSAPRASARCFAACRSRREPIPTADRLSEGGTNICSWCAWINRCGDGDVRALRPRG